MSRSLELEDLYSFRLPEDPQLSPDGRSLAFTITTPDRDSDSDHSSIWTIPVEGGPAKALTHGEHDGQPRWSPDGRQLAFLGVRGEAAAPQLHLLPMEGGEPHALTDLPLGAGEAVWSPDGKRIAFVAAVDTDHEPGTPPEQVAGEPIVITTLEHKVDGLGRIRGLRKHLFVMDVDGGEPQQLTHGDFFVNGTVWSPDGSRIAFATSMSEDRDLSPTLAAYVIDASGGSPRRVSPEDGLLAPADWSPDGQTLLLVGMERLVEGHNRLFTIPVSGGDLQELTSGFDRNVMVGAPAYPGAIPRYVDEGRRVIFCAREHGRVHIFIADATEGAAPEALVDGDRIVSGLSEVAGTIAFVAGSWASPGELFIRDASGAEKQLTDLFSEALPQVDIVSGQERWFTAPDGTRIEGWVLGKAADEPGPLLLDIHGGPHNAWGPAFDPYHLYHQALVAQGWTILCINPRGSDGYGEEFWRALLAEGWGQADQQDFLAAVDQLVDDGIADPERIAVTGYSYGGLMTCMLTAKSDRFAAAIAGGCVSNGLSVTGTSDFGWLIRTLELENPSYDDMTLFERSAINHVTNVQTPTLLLHGAEDQRCPVGQAEEWFTALRSRRIPTEMVLYPGASHLFIVNGKPSHRIDYSTRVEQWLTRYATGSPAGVPTRAAAQLGRGFESWFRSVTARHKVPGASIAVLHGNDLVTAATGVLDIDTGVEATTDSLFQIGSITKTYVTTLVMQLVDEGLIDLDEPVASVLPEFKVADPDVTNSVTMRHLLTHTSGIQGDYFPDMGRGDDAVERYVASCAELTQSHPLGATMSYCNTGFVIAGRAIEKVTGTSWVQALNERLFQPLQLKASAVHPEDVLRHRAAHGHTVDEDGTVNRASQWHLPFSCGPAGLISATASDVISFARMHMDDGRAPDGTQVLSPGGVKSMQIEQVSVPDPYGRGSHWGLGWILFDWDGRRLFGHDGGTLGQLAFLRVLPEEELVVSMLTNSDKGLDLFNDVYGELFGDLAGIEIPTAPSPLDDPPAIDASRYAGTYEREASRLEVEEKDGRLMMNDIVTGPLAELILETEHEYVLHPVGDDVFVYRPQGTQTWTSLVFYELADGTTCIHSGGRATPKVS